MMSGNRSDGSKNDSTNYICGIYYPSDPHWVCSLSQGHRSPIHKAYRRHQARSRTLLVYTWGVAGGPSRKNPRKKTPEAEVAAAIASITGLMQSRQPQNGNQTSVPTQVAQTAVLTDPKSELTRIIRDLTTLRDSLP